MSVNEENKKSIIYKENVNIEFKDLTYSINMTRKKEKRLILKSISGLFKTGELTAIMGPSGAGKSTLLNILTGFITRGVGGTIKFGTGNEENSKDIQKKCCYIMQDDKLWDLFTLKECMVFAVNLKIHPKSMNAKEKLILVDDMLKTLKLSTACETRCNRLSGGEKKRLSLALELINNPAILFLDEPTTGLDSSSCIDLICVLQKLAIEGRTIVCTIHQPSTYMYDMFNQIYVLAHGCCVYQGMPQKTVQYLCSINLKCPSYHNPADFLLECLNGDYGDCIDDLVIAAKKPEWSYITSSFETSELFDVNEGLITSNKYIYPPSEFQRLLILIQRSYIEILRDWSVTYVKFVVYILIAVFFGVLYGDSGSNGHKQLSNIGLFVIHCIFLWYTNTIPAVLRYPNEIPLIKKETFNNWYKLRTYYMASFITAAPFNIISSLAYITIVHLMTDQLLELDRIGKVFINCAVLTICAEGSGLLLGTIFEPVTGVFFAAVFTCFLFIYSGFIALLNQMSTLMRSISYLSPMRYTFENFILALYDNNRPDTNCPPSVLYCHLKKSSTVLKTFGMESASYTLNLCLLFLHLIICKVATYFILKHRINKMKINKL